MRPSLFPSPALPRTCHATSRWGETIFGCGWVRELIGGTTRRTFHFRASRRQGATDETVSSWPAPHVGLAVRGFLWRRGASCGTDHPHRRGPRAVAGSGSEFAAGHGAWGGDVAIRPRRICHPRCIGRHVGARVRGPPAATLEWRGDHPLRNHRRHGVGDRRGRPCRWLCPSDRAPSHPHLGHETAASSATLGAHRLSQWS